MRRLDEASLTDCRSAVPFSAYNMIVEVVNQELEKAMSKLTDDEEDPFAEAAKTDPAERSPVHIHPDDPGSEPASSIVWPNNPEEGYRTKKARRVVRIAAVPRPNIAHVYRGYSVEVPAFAVSDDGTMWPCSAGRHEWLEVRNVAQPWSWTYHG